MVKAPHLYPLQSYEEIRGSTPRVGLTFCSSQHVPQRHEFERMELSEKPEPNFFDFFAVNVSSRALLDEPRLRKSGFDRVGSASRKTKDL